MPKGETKKTKSYLLHVDADLWYNYALCRPREFTRIEDHIVLLIQEFVDGELTNKKKHIPKDKENGLQAIIKGLERRVAAIENKPTNNDGEDDRLKFMRENNMPLSILDVKILRKYVPDSESMSKKELLEILE